MNTETTWHDRPAAARRARAVDPDADHRRARHAASRARRGRRTRGRARRRLPVDGQPVRLAAACGDGEGLVRIGLASEDHGAILDGLAETVSPRMLRSGRRTDPVVRQLDEYFSGDRRRFDVELDLHLVRGFRHDVLTHLVDVGYGTTVSYAVLAAASGNPRAVRAAGSACSHNPIPLVVPCHRVVRSDGSVGNYAGGSEMKVSLLAMESGSADLATTRH
ncbi:MAG: methylated-DNA--[protein]-cysteine S-methyltransferase [Ilumatobacteraceae bacterium]